MISEPLALWMRFLLGLFRGLTAERACREVETSAQASVCWSVGQTRYLQKAKKFGHTASIIVAILGDWVLWTFDMFESST